MADPFAPASEPLNSAAELLVDKGRAELIAALTITIIVLGSVTLAIQNVVHRVALAPSIFWLLLVASVALSAIWKSGIRAYSVSVLSSFSRQQLLRVRPNRAGNMLEVGFKLFKLRVVELRIPAENLVSLYWHTGQASDMAGRDVNDWSVFLWYRHGDLQREAKQKKSRLRRPDQALLVIGPARAKHVTVGLGQRVATFLSAAGVSVAVDGSKPETAA